MGTQRELNRHQVFVADASLLSSGEEVQANGRRSDTKVTLYHSLKRSKDAE
jgi:hypothetical protein